MPDASFLPTRVPPIEARRLRAAKLSDVPAPAEVLAKHFAGAAGPFDVQVAELTALGRRAVLAMEANKPTSEARPLALVVDDGNGVVWSKDHPIGGITPPVGPVAIAAAPRGRVAMAACDPPTNVIALRLWDSDGFPFADFQAMTGATSCDALALLFWPDHGWLIVAAGAGATRARLIKESGGPAWGDALDVGVRSRPGAVSAPSLAADTDESFVLVQLAQPTAEPGSPFHALAFRYDAYGTAIWKEAVDLGELARPPAPGEKVKIVPASPGVRVTLPSGAELEVRPSGDKVSRGRAQP